MVGILSSSQMAESISFYDLFKSEMVESPFDANKQSESSEEESKKEFLESLLELSLQESDQAQHVISSIDPFYSGLNKEVFSPPPEKLF